MGHARNSSYCEHMSLLISNTINGFNYKWWSSKHNTHHVMTNHVGVDPDIDLMPAIFLLAPSLEYDSHYRKYQHYYTWVLYAFLYVAWRTQSIERAVADRDYLFLASIVPGYLWLATLPIAVSVGSILVGGFLVAMVVTQSHEMEPMNFDTRPTSFAKTQFDGTRDIVTADPVTEYLFGGMQYQLTHHLFPTLPRWESAHVNTSYFCYYFACTSQCENRSDGCAVVRPDG